jgi:hypothetical protein
VGPALPLVENMNRAVEISTRQLVMQLDDDAPPAGAAVPPRAVPEVEPRDCRRAEPTIRRCQAAWYQFILAGAYGRRRLGRRAEAREVLRLFDLAAVRALGPSPGWLPVRMAIKAAAAIPRRAA